MASGKWPPVLTPRQLAHAQVVSAARSHYEKGCTRMSWVTMLAGAMHGKLLSTREWNAQNKTKEWFRA